MEKSKQRKRRSEPLTPAEHKAFKKLYASYPTKIDASEAIGLSYQVMDLVAIKGTGNPDTLKVIRKALSAIPV